MVSPLHQIGAACGRQQSRSPRAHQDSDAVTVSTFPRRGDSMRRPFFCPRSKEGALRRYRPWKTTAPKISKMRNRHQNHNDLRTNVTGQEQVPLTSPKYMQSHYSWLSWRKKIAAYTDFLEKLGPLINKFYILLQSVTDISFGHIC